MNHPETMLRMTRERHERYQDEARRTHGGKLHVLQLTQDVVLLGGDPRRHVLDRPQLIVDVDELDQVPTWTDGDIAQRDVGDHPLA